MALRSLAADLARLFDAAPAPIYVLDDQGRIVYVNEACAAWAGLPATELVGRESRYHSSSEIVAGAAVAAALAPPPDVWAGRRSFAVVSLDAPTGTSVAQRVEFLPLGSDAIDVTGVLALASPTVQPVTESSDQPQTEEPSARELHQQLRQWRRMLGRQFHLDRLLGDHPAMRLARKQVELASTSAASVTIIGPAGSGRQHAAHAIHYGRDPQTAGPLVPLACPLLAPGLLESTIRSLAHRVETVRPARPATLVLSDIDQLDAETQQHLVHCWPTRGEFRVVGTSCETLSVLVQRGTFRADLASSLSTLEIRLLPLAERIDDLPLLAQMLVEEENRRTTKQVAGIAPEALDQLALYSWPGNVAELAEVIVTAHAQTEGPVIAPVDLPAKIRHSVDALAHPRRVETTIVLEKFLAEIELELIQRALKRARGNKTKAARLLGMTRPRLYRRLVQLGLEKADGNE